MKHTLDATLKHRDPKNKVQATDLGAVEYVVVSVLLCAGGHGDDVRPRAGLGHGQRAHVLAAAQLGKVL